MRADRLISLLLFMQGRERVTAAEIAAELEVSVATARRDLDALSLAGVPVYPQPGRHGGWSLLGGARTDLTGLTAPEARALFSLVGATEPVAADARSALRKVVRALPSTFREGAVAASEAVVVDAARWGQVVSAENRPVLDTLRAAVIERRRVELDHAPPGRPSAVRTVDPWGLVDKDGSWYLVAGTSRGRRTFRLDRVESAAATQDHFERPAGFDLGTVWREVVEEIEERRAGVACTVRIPSRFVFVLESHFGRHCAVLTDADGLATVRVSASTVLDIARTLAGWGSEALVLEPEEVRRELARIGTELADAYRESPHRDVPGRR